MAADQCERGSRSRGGRAPQESREKRNEEEEEEVELVPGKEIEWK